MSLDRAELNRAEAGVTNVFLHDTAVTPLEADHSFDFVMTVDALHDMARPDEAALVVHGALKPDGMWFIEDMDAAPSFEEGLRRDRRRMAFGYALSMTACLPSSLSEPNGAGLGSLGLPEPAMRELVAAAGFRQFRRLELRRPPAAFYEARP